MKQKSKGQVIAITNQKGGVGKTTTAIHLGVGLAKHHYKVLLVDLDPQGSLSYYLGYDLDSLPYSIGSLFNDLLLNQALDDQEGILHHEEMVDILPATPKDMIVEEILCLEENPEHFLKNYTDVMKKNYDFILIDCGPFRGKLMLNALNAADQVIIPSDAQTGSMAGMTQLLETIYSVRECSNYSLKISGILITKTRQNTRYEKNVVRHLKDSYGNALKIYSNMIPLSVRAGESVDYGCSVFKSSPTCSVAKAYEKVVEEFLNE